MNRPASLLALLALLFVADCALAQTPAGKLYAPGPFDRFEVEGAAVVRLRQGPRDQVFIAGPADVQDSVEVELSGHQLTIHPAGGWKFWSHDRLQVEVQMRQLSQLTLSGATDLHAIGPIHTDKLEVNISGAAVTRFDDLDAGRLSFDISGAGDGQLAGRADKLSLSVSGKGKLKAEQMRASRADVSIDGVGEASLWVIDNLNIDISGVGHVDYWGQPAVRRSTSGMGSIVARGDKH